jgi:hypothetical protein
MCLLYGEVKKRGAAAALNNNSTAQRLLHVVARAHVLATALENDGLASVVKGRCGLGDIMKEAEAVRGTLDEAAAHPEELRKIKNEDFAEWVTTKSPTDDAGIVIKNLRSWFTYELAYYKLNHALNERGELDEEKLKEAAKEFENVAEIGRALGQWENYLASSNWALRARILAAKSWEEFLKMAEDPQKPKATESIKKLWEETEKRIEPTAGYLATAAAILGEYLVYLAASGKKKEVEELLKEWRWLLDYRPEVSVATRLMLVLFGIKEGAGQGEVVVDVFVSQLLPELWPTLLMQTGRIQKEQALKECAKLPKPEVCVVAVAAADRLKPE